ncbi:MAG: FecR domain-containing protein [Niabella sp.]|nr:FecR domain-containing protein [Niabella sp.]
MISKSAAYYNGLIELYLNGQCTPEQEKELWMYLSSSRSNKAILDQLQKKFDLDTADPQLLDDSDSKRLFNKITEVIGRPESIPWRACIKWLRFAAILVVLAGAVILFVSRTQVGDNAPPKLVKNDVLPGGNRGIMVLAGGARIDFERIRIGDTVKESGLVIAKTGNGEVRMRNSGSPVSAGEQPQMNTIQTPVGGQYKVTLSDGTTVWMNAGSVLKFPVTFTDTERSVQAEGELYFEVAKDAAHPFRVKTGEQVVEVLGTHFSVKSNANNAIVKTTLLEGRIRISGGTAQPRILEPGEASEFQAKTNELKVTAYKNPEAVTAWKDGYFSFDSTDFITVQEQLEKWYDVRFVYAEVPQMQFFGKVPRNVPLSRVLKLMEMVGAIKFKIDGREVYVTNG